jgi:hypothetical protein
VVGAVLQLPEAVVAQGVRHIAQRRSGEKSVLRIAGEAQVPGLEEQAVALVAVGNRIGAVDAQGGDAEVVVVAARDASGNLSGPGCAGQERAVVRVGEGSAAWGGDTGELARRGIVAVAVSRSA